MYINLLSKGRKHAYLKQINLHCGIAYISPSSVHRKCVFAYSIIILIIILTSRRIGRWMWIQLYPRRTHTVHKRVTNHISMLADISGFSCHFGAKFHILHVYVNLLITVGNRHVGHANRR